MHKNCESTRRFGTNGWRLTIQIKGKTRKDAERALTRVFIRVKEGRKSGAESTDTLAYIFKLQEASR